MGEGFSSRPPAPRARRRGTLGRYRSFSEEAQMTRTIAARIHTAALRAEDGQGTVEYVGLPHAMSTGVLRRPGTP